MERTGERFGSVVVPIGVVTLLLADIEGSTILWEHRPAEMADAIARFNEIVSAEVHAHAGVRPLEQGEGDSFVAAFPLATDGVACALALQLQFGDPAAGWPFRVRMALHAGEVQLRDEGNYVGPTINRCARVRGLAHGGQTVLSQAVQDLVAGALPPGASLDDMGTHRLRDLSRPERIFQLRHPDLTGGAAPLRSLDAMPHNLPVDLTSFVGRQREINEVSALVRSDRQVTLVGTGGCGKTRLSLQVAALLLDDHPDGTWFVELAPLEDAALVAQATADAIGVRLPAGRSVTDALADALVQSRTLIVLDNCEHVLGAAADLAAALLSRCAGVTILASSREPLGVPGELTFTVPSLSIPADDAGQPATIASYESVQLFAERAARARSGFAITSDNAPAVVEICRRLDGIPLALELAAARIRVLTAEQIAVGLSDRFRLLTGGARTLTPRQQTLRASVDWSFDLLVDAERVALGRLSVFAGGFDLAAATAVLGSDMTNALDVLDLVTSLVDKSLVAVDDVGGEARYRMLETIRQYGAEHFAAAEALAVARSHREHYLDVLREAAIHEEGPEQQSWIDRLRREFDNIRAALHSAQAAGDGAALLELTCLAGNAWTLVGHPDEHREWLLAALAVAPPDAPFHANALYQLGVTDSFRGDLDSAIDRIGASIPLYEARNDERGAAWAAAEYAWNLCLRRGLAVGVPVYDEWIARAADGGELGALSSMEYGLGMCLAYGGHHDQAAAVLERALARPPVVAHFYRWTEIIAGWVNAQLGMIDKAIADEAAQQARGVPEDRIAVAMGNALIGEARLLAGDLDVAVKLADESVVAGVAFGAEILAYAYAVRGRVALARDDPTTAVADLREAMEQSASVSESWIALMAPWRAEALLASGDLSAAATMIDDAISSSRANDYPAHLANALVARARVEREQRDAERAAAMVHEAIPIFRRLGSVAGPVDALELLAVLAVDAGANEEAARLWGAAGAARTGCGYRLRWPHRARSEDPAVGAARAVLGDDAFDAATAAGAALTAWEACEYAARGRGERKRPASGWAALTPTEERVALLVAEGLTNPQVGERLFVSRHTVDSHLRHIFAKLGVSSRAELAGLAGRRMA